MSIKKDTAGGRPRRPLWLRLTVPGALILLVGSGLLVGVMQYLQYHRDLELAQAGVQHLRRAETQLRALTKNPFDTRSTAQAGQEFGAALTLFHQVSTDLSALPGVSNALPVVGSQVTAAQHLLPLAIVGAQVGLAVCQQVHLLAPALRNPLSATGPQLTRTDLDAAAARLQQIQLLFGQLLIHLAHLSPADLQVEPGLQASFGTLSRDGPALQDALTQARNLLAVAPVVLGVDAPARYLIEIQDATELRPGGGFIGNYGLVTLSGGHVSDIQMTDVDLIDRPFEAGGHTIAYPPAYRWFDLAPASWSLRDSNLDADFPTNARNGEQTYAQEEAYARSAGVEPLADAGGPLQGVVAITPWFIQGLLSITGPISMQPEYAETITAQNVVDRIHLHQLGNHHGSELIPSPDGHSSQRKRFTSYLADHLLARVRQLIGSSAVYSSLLKLLTRSLAARDIQIYLNAGAAEQALAHYHLDAGVQAPGGDSLFVVDANISPNKASNFLQYTLHDQVTLGPSGEAVHQSTLSYAWILQGTHLNYGSPLYRDVVHVYVPPGARLLAQSHWQAQGVSASLGRSVWLGYFTLGAGQTRTITLTWVSPGAAQHDSQGWHYRYLVQKQAGDTWLLDLQVSTPACARALQASGGLVAAGHSADVHGPLSADRNLTLTYTCAQGPAQMGAQK
jgi:hypothetical protein